MTVKDFLTGVIERVEEALKEERYTEAIRLLSLTKEVCDDAIRAIKAKENANS